MSARRLPALLFPALLLGAGWARGADETPAAANQAAYAQQIRPVLEKFCVGCHGAINPSGGVSFTAFRDVTSIQRDQTTWRKVLTQLRDRTMPPKGQPQPSDDQRERLVIWVAHTLRSTDDDLLPKNPGRVLIHRLSRAEYNNTVRDLFGIRSKPADKFPADGGGGGGFDNNADTLFIPPILMERYLTAAGEILNETSPARLFFARPNRTLSKRAAGRQIVVHYAMLAWRRPVEPVEVDRLMRLFDRATQRGLPFEGAVRFALKAVLISPNFLFRAELDGGNSGPYRIGDYELASRLSYFLWSSMPDAELFRLAGQKRLHSPDVLAQQVTRMLRSPKAQAFADGFAGQWLRVRDLYTSARPDPNRFKDYTPTLRDAMVNETIDFFGSLFHDDASLLNLLDSDYTYVNEELAKHYGIEGVTGPEMRRVTLANHRRGGVLTQASVLTLTSFPQRTSPVLRGKWVLAEVLGAPPPPPPPVVAILPPDDAPTKEGLTFRQQLEKHREKPECAGCHARMDPIGFGLENYDATGRWRTEIGGKPVDASGALATGEKFNGPAELKQHLLERKDEFIRNLTEKMLAYALGRGLEPYDSPAVQQITAAVAKDGYRSTTLIRAIVMSYPFQYRNSM
jgi:hypothetical protein